MAYTITAGSGAPATWWTLGRFRREWLTHRHRHILSWLLKKGDVLLDNLIEHALGTKPKCGTRKGDNAIQAVEYSVWQLIDVTLVESKRSFIDATTIRWDPHIREIIGLSFTGWVLAMELENEKKQ